MAVYLKVTDVEVFCLHVAAIELDSKSCVEVYLAASTVAGFSRIQPCGGKRLSFCKLSYMPEKHATRLSAVEYK